MTIVQCFGAAFCDFDSGPKIYYPPLLESCTCWNFCDF